ncbi:MAG: ATP-binding protein [Paracoccaceae bacterium]
MAAVKAGMQVYRATFAELVEVLAKAERQGQLAVKIRFYARSSLLIVDEIGYLPITQGGANLFFQLVNVRYEKGAFAIGLEPMATQYLTPAIQQRLRRMGRRLRRSCYGHRAP